MYTQRLKVCATNHALGSENQKLHRLNDMVESRMQLLEALAAEKDEKFRYIKQSLKEPKNHFVKHGTRLGHMITSGKTFDYHSGIGFQGETSGYKTVFMKSGLLTDLINPPKKGKFVINSIVVKGKPTIHQTIAKDH